MQINTITDILKNHQAQMPQHPVFFERSSDGNWSSTTWHQFYMDVKSFIDFLKDSDIKPNDHIAICAPNSYVWEVAQMAVWWWGGIIVAVDVKNINKQIEYIQQHISVKGLLVADEALFKELSEANAHKIGFVKYLSKWQRGTTGDFITIEDGSVAERDAVIMFTSGTTGQMKALSFNHYQHVETAMAIKNWFKEVNQEDTVVSWLPLSNMFQRMHNFAAMLKGVGIYIVENPMILKDDMCRINPAVFVAIPRFYEKIKEAIEQGVAKQPKPAQMIFMTALRINQRLSMANPIRKMIDDALFKKIRERIVGKRMKFMICGSAFISPKILYFFKGLGLIILEAYGTSENILPNSMNALSEYKFGSVGKPLAGNTVKVSPEGEIVVKGYGVFKGYLNDPSNNCFDAEGFYKTGDLGFFDKEGFLHLQGRLNEVVKTSTGRKIALIPIEDKFKALASVDQCVIFAEGRKYNIGIMTLKSSANQNIDAVRAEAMAANAQLVEYEQVKAWIILPAPFAVESGELTTNLKIRRRFIEQKYKDVITVTDIEIEKNYHAETKKNTDVLQGHKVIYL